jgi:hypothetical protein
VYYYIAWYHHANGTTSYWLATSRDMAERGVGYSERPLPLATAVARINAICASAAPQAH